MRPIDADALRNAMYHEAFETDTDMQRWDGGCWIRYKMFENVLEKMPVVSPQVERKTGRWIHDEFGSRCGACGLYAYRDKFDRPWESPYCPNCGAKMDTDAGTV